MQNSNPVVDELIADLVGLGKLRVWSVIVSILGDLLRDRGDAISAADLAQITSRMGIKPDASRVAIHRLKNDGWITVKRSGRHRHYLLSEYGFGETEAARPRIYSPSLPRMGRQFVIVTPPGARSSPDGVGTENRESGFQQIGPRIFLTTERPQGMGEEFLVLKIDAAMVPDWLKQILCPPGRLETYQRMHRVLENTVGLLAGSVEVSGTDATVLRILVIHRWRQIILNHPDLPGQFFPEEWPGASCRELVQLLLKKLKP